MRARAERLPNPLANLARRDADAPDEFPWEALFNQELGLFTVFD